MQYQTPAHLAPTFDQHHRPVHPAPQAMTPSRPMAPAPSMAPLPHANTGHVYNVPRAPEVYTLADPVDAAIPGEVREQFQRDEQGRVLFFTAPPLNRPNNGVAEQYAGLGHSVRHLASIKQLREERARKRKERDDALALEQQASKKLALLKERQTTLAAQAEEKSQYELLEKVLRGWAAEIDRGTKVLDEQIGGIDNWNRMMEEGREQAKGMTDREKRDFSLKWYADWMVERGGSEEEKKSFLETFGLLGEAKEKA
jgi:chromatin structure-remodeling complex subunit RSC1/2